MFMVANKLENINCDSMRNEIYKLDEVMNVFNTKNDCIVTNKGVRNALKYFIEDNSDRDEVFDNMEHQGMMIYTIASHQKQVRALVRDPKVYSLKCENLNASEGFKSNPSVTTLKEWRRKELGTEQVKVSEKISTSRKSLLEELGGSSVSEDETHSKLQKSDAGKKRKADKLSSGESSTAVSNLDQSPSTSVLRASKKQKASSTSVEKESGKSSPEFESNEDLSKKASQLQLDSDLESVSSSVLNDMTSFAQEKNSQQAS
ncbi:hypothetical protein AWC38_SpisGene13380 [Stylophora pistillata]|uniref:Uncharacterized protein n=1 Tax=Stylophora pistillata TaxID=50429 RepID=A0A2B4RWU7_STYPI|nr:hypothetical protein AWC38_SpisGene13380 [Stylophora pistillata]